MIICSNVFTALKHLDECPQAPRIPMYLVVGGMLGVVNTLHLLWYNRALRSLRSDWDDDFDIDELDALEVNGNKSGGQGLGGLGLLLRKRSLAGPAVFVSGTLQFLISSAGVHCNLPNS